MKLKFKPQISHLGGVPREGLCPQNSHRHERAPSGCWVLWAECWRPMLKRNPQRDGV